MNKTHLIHNHPSDGWGNFSGTDLETFATSNLSGMSAISRKAEAPIKASESTLKAYSNRRAGEYRITKTQHFNRDAFLSAIHSITVQDIDYDKGLSRWLRNNQRKYGYK